MSSKDQTIHGTLVVIENQGLLLTGPSGAGKSDLALRLITQSFPPDICAHPPLLVADDQVRLEKRDGKLYGKAPSTLEGLLEIRHVGIEKVPFVKEAEITALVAFTPANTIERLPQSPWPTKPLDEIDLPLIMLDPTEPSAPVKLIFAARKL